MDAPDLGVILEMYRARHDELAYQHSTIGNRAYVDLDKTLCLSSSPIEPALGMLKSRIVCVGDERVDLCSRILVNPVEAKGQQHWVLRFARNNDQSDTETDLKHVDLDTLPFQCLYSSSNIPPLVGKIGSSQIVCL